MRSVCTEPLRHQTPSQINFCKDPEVKPSRTKIVHLMFVCSGLCFFLESSPQTTSGSRLLDPQTGSKIQHQGMYQCSRASKHINMKSKSYHCVQLWVSLAECASWTWSCVFCFSILNLFSVHGKFVCAWTFSIYSNTKTYGVFCFILRDVSLDFDFWHPIGGFTSWHPRFSEGDPHHPKNSRFLFKENTSVR